MKYLRVVIHIINPLLLISSLVVILRGEGVWYNYVTLIIVVGEYFESYLDMKRRKTKDAKPREDDSSE